MHVWGPGNAVKPGGRRGAEGPREGTRRGRGGLGWEGPRGRRALTRDSASSHAVNQVGGGSASHQPRRAGLEKMTADSDPDAR